MRSALLWNAGNTSCNCLSYNLQPLYKGQLQRLLLNLCAHRDSRKSLVQILVDMLMLDLQGSSKKSIDGTEPPFRLYGCHANITYSRPQSSDGNLVFTFFCFFGKCLIFSA
jgi:hypothetical protein